MTITAPAIIGQRKPKVHRCRSCCQGADFRCATEYQAINRHHTTAHGTLGRKLDDCLYRNAGARKAETENCHARNRNPQVACRTDANCRYSAAECRNKRDGYEVRGLAVSKPQPAQNGAGSHGRRQNGETARAKVEDLCRKCRKELVKVAARQCRSRLITAEGLRSPDA